ncbi:MAG: HAD-IIA family hydrolase [Cyclobacteriaceae bacterium]
MLITPFKSIVNQYSTIFFDAFGVLKNHGGLIPGIEDTFKYLEDNNIEYFIITNDASRGPLELAEDYQTRGLKQITKSKIVSSGMLAREYLKLKVKEGTVAYLGTDASAHYLQTSGINTVSIGDLNLDDAESIKALVFMDDEGYDWQKDINKALNLLRMVNIPAIISNTDKTYPTSKSEVAIAAGALANMIEDISGKSFIRFGKPDAQMFIFAHEHAVAQGGTSDRSKILMVGDTLGTDILGGNKFGLDTALVLTGNTLEKYADMRITTSGIAPTYICHSAVIE